MKNYLILFFIIILTTNVFAVITDGFEDNAWNSAGRTPTWRVFSGTAGGVSVSNTIYKNGSYGLQLSTSSNPYLVTALRDYVDNTEYSSWAYTNNSSSVLEYCIGDTNGTADSVCIKLTNGGSYYNICDTGNQGIGTISNSNWYQLIIKPNAGAGTTDIIIKNSAGAIIDQNLNISTACITAPTVMIVGQGGAGGEAYFDDVSYSGLTVNYYDINFYVKGKIGQTNLTNFNMDCNDNIYDGNFNSPKTHNIMQGNYSCTFSRTSYDSNSNYVIIADSNKEYTIYLSEQLNANFTYTLNKVLGQLQLKDASTSPISIVDWNWLSNGSKVSDSQDYNLSVVVNTDYNVCLQISDSSTNKQTCQTISTGEWTAPTTTFSYTLPSDSNTATITLTCTDAGSGCASTAYRIDGGSWNTYTTPFTFAGTGYHYIDYNSTDNNANIETTKRSDLNMPVYLTIKYPKNEETLAQITEKWKLDITGTVNFSYTDLNADKNLYLPPNTPLTIKIVDVNGNYFSRTYVKDYNGNVSTDTLQPYLVSTSTGLLTTINAVSASSNQPIEGVTFKIYKNISGLGRTLVEELLTDSKGQELSLLVLGASYEFEAYYGGVFLKTFNITATSATIFFVIDLGDTITNPPSASGFTVSWNPISNLIKSTTGTQAFTQTLNNLGSKTITATSTITQNSTTLGTSSYSGSSNHTFSYTLNNVDFNVGTLIQTITVVTDTNTYVFTQTIIVTQGFGENYNPIWGLQYGLRQDLSCSSDPLVPCYPLLVLAILLCVALTLWATVQFGAFGGQSTGLIFLIGMILFTFLTWIPVWVTAGLVLISLAFIVNERRA